MNIYRIIEDGEAKCWQAESMQDAIAAAEAAYMSDYPVTSPMKRDAERAYWYIEILQSCELLGELTNP